MTQKFLNDGVKILGLGLRVLIDDKERQIRQLSASSVYFTHQNLDKQRLWAEFDVNNLREMLHNLDGCKELLPIYDSPEQADAAPAISVGSMEERTGLLAQIAELEKMLERAEKTFEAQGERFQKAWDERTAEIGAEVNTNGTERQQKHIEYLQADLSERAQRIKALEEQNNRLCEELAKQIEGSRELLTANTQLNQRCEAYKTVNESISGSNMIRAERITQLEEQHAGDRKRWQTEYDRKVKQLKQSGETVDALVETHNKVCDERDSLRLELRELAEQRDKANHAREIGEKVLARIQARFSNLKGLINETSFGYAEQFRKLRAAVNAPWTDEPETVTVCADAERLTRGFDNGRCTVSAADPEEETDAELPSDKMRIVLDFDTTEAEAKLRRLADAMKD